MRLLIRILYNKIVIYLLISLITGSLYAQQDEVVDGFSIEVINITFIKETSFEKNDILNIIQTGRSGIFSSMEFDQDIRRIDKFFFDNGYFDAQIDTNLQYDFDKKSVVIEFKINPNTPYTINKIEYSGLDKIYPIVLDKINKRLDKFIKLKDIYSRDNLSNEVIRVLDILSNNGYAQAITEQPEVIKIESQSVEYKNKVNIIHKFIPGNYFHFGKTKIEFTNNKHEISFEEIYNELLFHEGDVYSKSDLVESENRLSKVAIIDNGRIQIENIDSVKNVINFKIMASLRNKYEIQPELAGYDISNRFYGGAALSFTDRFFLGGGRTQTTKFQALYNSPTYNLLELSLDLFQPYIFNNNKIAGNWKLSFSLLKQDIYNISRFKNEFNVNYELPKFTYVNNVIISWKIGNDRYSVSEPVLVQITDSTSELVDGFNINLFSSIGSVTFVHNNTNNFAFPTRGNFQSFLIEESGLLSYFIRNLFNTSSYNYVKLTNVDKFYLRLTNNNSSVFAAKFLVGAIFEYGDNQYNIGGLNQVIGISAIPYEARFIAGGSSSVRGWNAGSLGTFQGRENGGNFLLESNLEHRTKPFSDSKGFFRDVGFVSFVDFGNLWENPSKFRIDQIAIAIGGGLRYYTLVGPFRFDIGFKFYDWEAPTGQKWLFENDLNTILKSKIVFQFGIGNTF